ncbi:MAG: peptide-methionine (S)-S-oxide reductase MsrA [Planctomycetota bacterium]
MLNPKPSRLLLLTSLLALCAACQQTPAQLVETTSDGSAVAETKDAQAGLEKKELSKAYFASGCFWCVEAVYESVRGVEESISGYAGGHTENPTYELSNTGRTGHAEAVEVYYDPAVVDFESLVDVYFGSQNITQQNGQGPDRGSQYRSILFYQNEDEKRIIETKIAALNASLDGEKVAAEVMPFKKFWIGEDYHQDYEKKHPDHPYIRNVSIPRLERFQAKFPELLKDSAGH